MRLRPPRVARPAVGGARSAGWRASIRRPAREAARLLGRLIAHDLREVGIDIDCAPVLDVATPGMTEAIGSRSFAAEPDLVADARAAPSPTACSPAAWRR